MDLFAEGLWAIRLPCTLALLVPGFVPLFGSRNRAPLAVGFYVLAAAAVFWLRSTGNFFDQPKGLLALAVGLVVIGLAILGWKAPRGRPATVAAIVTSSGFGVVSAWLWIPCVGTHLGRLLNRTSTETWAPLPQFAVYVAGVCALLIALAALPYAVERLARFADNERLAMVGVSIGVAFGVIVGVGLYEDIVAQLLQWSLKIQ